MSRGRSSRVLVFISLYACALSCVAQVTSPVLDLEGRRAFDFFWNEANADPASPGYGLVPKGLVGANREISSVAGVGFGLVALTIGAERGWVARSSAEERVRGTLTTLLNNVDQEHGFFYHFVRMDTATRNAESEVSTVDTVRAISGAIVAGEYFGGEVKSLADQLYRRVEWPWFRDPERNQFRMGYRPDSGFSGYWGNSGEQLAMYVLSAGSPTHPVGGDTFYAFTRQYGSYGGGPQFIHSFFGSMHTYLYSHAWVDFRHRIDLQGVDWWANSLAAVTANRQYSIDRGSTFRTLGPNAWGLLASKGPSGYEGRNGAPPSGNNSTAHVTTGTLPAAGAATAIVLTPDASIAALENYYTNHPQLWGQYGFFDAHNLDVTPEWYADDISVINKGASLLMIENYRSGFVWNWFMRSGDVQNGIAAVGLSPKFSVSCDPSSMIVSQGASGTTQCTVTSTNGFSAPIALSCGNLPAGVTCAHDPDAVTPPADGSISSTLTVGVDPSAMVGSHAIQLRATIDNALRTSDVNLTVAGGDQFAVFDATLQALKCGSVGRSCDSGPSLLLGRDGKGPEPNRPNTIGDSCADGTSGTFHVRESNDRIRVLTVDGSELAQGKTVRVEATVWASTMPSQDKLDLYFAPSASSPVWTRVITLTPAVAGAQTLSATYVLPAGSLQAVRARFRYQGTAGACGLGVYDDHDDLIFAVQ